MTRTQAKRFREMITRAAAKLTNAEALTSISLFEPWRRKRLFCRRQGARRRETLPLLQCDIRQSHMATERNSRALGARDCRRGRHYRESDNCRCRYAVFQGQVLSRRRQNLQMHKRRQQRSRYDFTVSSVATCGHLLRGGDLK